MDKEYKVEECHGRYDILKNDGTVIMDRFNNLQDAEYIVGALNIGLINWTGKHLSEFQKEILDKHDVVGTCHKCGKVIHYRYPCDCKQKSEELELSNINSGDIIISKEKQYLVVYDKSKSNYPYSLIDLSTYEIHNSYSSTKLIPETMRINAVLSSYEYKITK